VVVYDYDCDFFYAAIDYHYDFYYDVDVEEFGFDFVDVCLDYSSSFDFVYSNF